jgi:hypothetical protein
MPVSSDIVAQGSLTGGNDLIHTSAGTEFVQATFVNYAASSGTLNLWLNGTADYQRVGPPGMTLATHEMAVLKVKLGNTDTIYAKGNEETFGYTLELDSLT